MASYTFSSRLVVLRVRSCVHGTLVAFGVLWIGMLSLDAYLRGGYRTTREWAAVVILLAANALTSISIPIFALLDYSDTSEGSYWFNQIRFESAFTYFHFLSHTTAAAVFTAFSPHFECDISNINPDAEGTCRLINVYISIASWLTPLILLAFIAYFSTVSLRTAKRFPKLWRTAVRFCPWDNPSDDGVTADDRRGSSQPGSRKSESGRGSLTTTQSSSPGSSISYTPFIKPSYSPLRGYSTTSPLRQSPRHSVLHTASQVPPRRVVSQFLPPQASLRPPAYRPISQPLSMGATQPAVNKARLDSAFWGFSHPSSPHRPPPWSPPPRRSMEHTKNVYGLDSGHHVGPLMYNGPRGAGFSNRCIEIKASRYMELGTPPWLGKGK